MGVHHACMSSPTACASASTAAGTSSSREAMVVTVKPTRTAIPHGVEDVFAHSAKYLLVMVALRD